MDRYINIPAAIAQCATDLAATGKISLEAQSRAYDLLDSLLSDENRSYTEAKGYAEAAERFAKAYAKPHAEYDEEALRKELAQKLAPLNEALEEIRFKAASAASLHEFAKEVFEIWKTAGIFARKRALKELRERAGFRLESHRIGNYVAKTFDLMNQADADFARSQQALFAANVAYKIQPGIYAKIAGLL